MIERSRRPRFGVIFSGGTAAGMNATLEYLARYALQSDAELIGFKHGWIGLIENDIKPINTDLTRGIGLTSGGTFLGSCNKINVFNHEGKDFSKICHENYCSRRLDGIFVLGGDGTNRQANELNENFPDMKFIWISATLDRDVAGCDDTIGFHTAVENAAEAIRSMQQDGETMHRHVIIECMGRHSGCVTAYAADLAIRKYGTPVDILLIPEVKFNIQAITNRIACARKPLTIVISEGITLEHDDKDEKEEIAGHHQSLANTCQKLLSILKPVSGLDIKTHIAGYTQRTGKLSSADMFLADQCAKIGMQQALDGNSSMAIVFENSTFKAIPMADLVELNRDSSGSKSARLLEDSVITVLQDQLAAGALTSI